MFISEIIHSLQGEGRNMNVPTSFVRFQGCNLKPGCKWCDTQYARRDGGKDMSLDDIMQEIEEHRDISALGRYRHVCITGGEPLMHEIDLTVLVGALKAEKNYVEIFTNGSLSPPAWWHIVDCFVADIKCPSSGTSSPAIDYWFKMRPQDQVKFVVANEADLDFVLSTQPESCRPEVIISPMIPVGTNGQIDMSWARTVAHFCVRNDYRFSLQQHKLLYGDKRGV